MKSRPLAALALISMLLSAAFHACPMLASECKTQPRSTYSSCPLHHHAKKGAERRCCGGVRLPRGAGADHVTLPSSGDAIAAVVAPFSAEPCSELTLWAAPEAKRAPPGAPVLPSSFCRPPPAC